MKLTKVQKHLLDGLQMFGVHLDPIIPMMIALKNDEDGMMELMDYMKNENPTAHEIIKKSVEIATREPQSVSR